MPAPRLTDVRLEPTRRTSLSRLIADQVLALIQDGSLKPGDRLPSESEMMRMLNVGRSSVREGMRGLSLLGLVETHPGRSTVIAANAKSPFEQLRLFKTATAPLRKRALLDLLEVRECLEGQAAQLAAERATAHDIAAMRKLADQVAGDVALRRVYFRSNKGFHLSVARAAHNPVLESSVSLLIGQARRQRETLMKQLGEMPEQDVADHAAIVSAIAERDGETARRAMVDHIRRFARLVREAP